MHPYSACHEEAIADLAKMESRMLKVPLIGSNEGFLAVPNVGEGYYGIGCIENAPMALRCVKEKVDDCFEIVDFLRHDLETNTFSSLREELAAAWIDENYDDVVYRVFNDITPFAPPFVENTCAWAVAEEGILNELADIDDVADPYREHRLIAHELGLGGL